MVWLLRTSRLQPVKPGRINKLAKIRNVPNGIASHSTIAWQKLSENICEKVPKFILKAVYKHANGRIKIRDRIVIPQKLSQIPCKCWIAKAAVMLVLTMIQRRLLNQLLQICPNLKR